MPREYKKKRENRNPRTKKKTTRLVGTQLLCSYARRCIDTLESEGNSASNTGKPCDDGTSVEFDRRSAGQVGRIRVGSGLRVGVGRGDVRGGGSRGAEVGAGVGRGGSGASASGSDGTSGAGRLSSSSSLAGSGAAVRGALEGQNRENASLRVDFTNVAYIDRSEGVTAPNGNNGDGEGDRALVRVDIVGNSEGVVKFFVKELEGEDFGVAGCGIPGDCDLSLGVDFLGDMESQGGNQRGHKGEESELAEHFRGDSCQGACRER
jgi:hypothetical protein